MAKPRPSLWPNYLTYWNLLFKHIHTLLDNIQASSMVLNQFRCFVGYKKNPFWVQKESSKMLGTEKILFGYKKNFISNVINKTRQEQSKMTNSGCACLACDANASEHE